jgi:SAM-dependent methyltransferase
MAAAPTGGSDLDLSRPNAARVYDYYLGGALNFRADREFAAQVMTAMPEVPATARSNRSFLARAVRHCLQAGIRQFLDLGAGLPTVGAVHEIAHRADPDARVVYVDNEPIAVAHARQLLSRDPNVAVLEADLRDPATVLAGAPVRDLLDLSRPIAVLTVFVLHFIPDSDDPAAVLSAYREAAAPGSLLVLSHAGPRPGHEPTSDAARVLYDRTATPLVLRTADQLRALLAAAGITDVVQPGIVPVPLWRPDADFPDPDWPDPTLFPGHALVARLGG